MMLTFEIALYDSQFAHHKRKCRVNVIVTDNANVYFAFNNNFVFLVVVVAMGETPAKICQ